MCLARLWQPPSTTDPLSFKGSHFKSSNVFWGVQAERNMDSQIWSSRCHWRAADRNLSSRCNAPKTFSLHSSAEPQREKNLLACQPELSRSYFQHLWDLTKIYHILQAAEAFAQRDLKSIQRGASGALCRAKDFTILDASQKLLSIYIWLQKFLQGVRRTYQQTFL